MSTPRLDANTRAFYRGLQTRVRTAGRTAAEAAVAEQVTHATTTDASGAHLGGWRDDSRTLVESIGAVRDRARSTPSSHVYQIQADPRTGGADRDYTVDLERRGFWVVTGLGDRARVWFRALFPAHFRRLRD